jgi:hypothetical protein
MNPMLVKTDSAGFVKDLNSGAVLNTNDGEYAAFMQNRERNMQFKQLTSEVNRLSNEVRLLHIQMQSLIERLNVNSTSSN